MRIAFVTQRDEPGGTADDALAARALAARGHVVTSLAWDDARADWASKDRVLLRSPWDYYRRVDGFLAWLAAVERARAPLWNPPALVRWNAHKSYLLDLARRGVPVVPTALVERGGAEDLPGLLRSRGWDEAVVKPAVSAGAHETFRVRRDDDPRRFVELVARGDVLVQPLVREVLDQGEWSFVFFGGAFSHALVKSAKQGDFRVQAEHGGSVRSVTPSPELVAQAGKVVASVREPWLYARVDAVRTGGGLLLMELEMIEPELFFRLDPAAAERFADAVERTPPLSRSAASM